MYISGTYFQLCQRCGFKYRNTETKREWTGLIVCHECWEPKHPQLKIRARKDKQGVKNPSPEPTDVYLSTSNPVTAADL